VSPPVVAPRPPAADEERRMIEAHIAKHGVTRAVSFGVHQAAVTTLREMGCHSVFRAGNRKRAETRNSWLIDGQPCSTATLYERANAERARRGLKPLKTPRGEG
jgi:hypothetical protein